MEHSPGVDDTKELLIRALEPGVRIHQHRASYINSGVVENDRYVVDLLFSIFGDDDAFLHHYPDQATLRNRHSHFTLGRQFAIHDFLLLAGATNLMSFGQYLDIDKYLRPPDMPCHDFARFCKTLCDNDHRIMVELAAEKRLRHYAERLDLHNVALSNLKEVDLLYSQCRGDLALAGDEAFERLYQIGFSLLCNPSKPMHPPSIWRYASPDPEPRANAELLAFPQSPSILGTAPQDTVLELPRSSYPQYPSSWSDISESARSSAYFSAHASPQSLEPHIRDSSPRDVSSPTSVPGLASTHPGLFSQAVSPLPTASSPTAFEPFRPSSSETYRPPTGIPPVSSETMPRQGAAIAGQRERKRKRKSKSSQVHGDASTHLKRTSNMRNGAQDPHAKLQLEKTIVSRKMEDKHKYQRQGMDEDANTRLHLPHQVPGKKRRIVPDLSAVQHASTTASCDVLALDAPYVRKPKMNYASSQTRINRRRSRAERELQSLAQDVESMPMPGQSGHRSSPRLVLFFVFLHHTATDNHPLPFSDPNPPASSGLSRQLLASTSHHRMSRDVDTVASANDFKQDLAPGSIASARSNDGPAIDDLLLVPRSSSAMSSSRTYAFEDGGPPFSLQQLHASPTIAVEARVHSPPLFGTSASRHAATPLLPVDIPPHRDVLTVADIRRTRQASRARTRSATIGPLHQASPSDWSFRQLADTLVVDMEPSVVTDDEQEVRVPPSIAHGESKPPLTQVLFCQYLICSLYISPSSLRIASYFLNSQLCSQVKGFNYATRTRGHNLMSAVPFDRCWLLRPYSRKIGPRAF